MCALKHGSFEHKKLINLIKMVKATKGLDLDLYRHSFLLRRVKVRMTNCGITSLNDYTKMLGKDQAEWNHFLDALSINVSHFFRDPLIFDFFNQHCLKKLIAHKEKVNHRMVRAWSAGCSYGEEAYSLAILLKEALAACRGFIGKIWATDVDSSALEAAEKGEYNSASLKFVKPEFMRAYFTETSDDVYSVHDTIKKLVSFRRHNIDVDPPLRYMDIIFFRNVRIYFDSVKAEEIILRLHGALRKGGYLVLGKTETFPNSLRDLFVSIEGSCKIFQKAESRKRR